MADFMKLILSKPIQLTDKVIKSAERASCFMKDCYELKSRTEELAQILGHVMAQSFSVSYQRPVRRIIDETEQVLNNTLSLVLKCCCNGHRKRVLGKTSGVDMREILRQLQKCVCNVIQLHSMLLLLYGHENDQTGLVDSPSYRTHNASDLVFEAIDDYYFHYQFDSPSASYHSVCHTPILSPLDDFSHPCTAEWPISKKIIIGYLSSDYINQLYEDLNYYDYDSKEFKKQRLWFTWPLIGYLYDSLEDNRLFGAYFLLSLCERNDEFKSLIIEEGGTLPLLKLLQTGSISEQRISAKVIGTLAYDSKSAQHIFEAGIYEFVELLKEGPLRVQAEVAWAISQLTANCPMVQDNVAKRRDIMHLLIDHLTFETIEDHNVESNNVINKATSVRAFVMAKSLESTSNTNEDETHIEKFSHSSAERELEGPYVNAHLKAMVAKAFWRLAKGNPSVCCSISQSRALMCFVVLLEKGITKGVKYYSAMALMEITAVVAQDSDLRRFVFKPSSPTCKSLVDQLVNVIEIETDTHLLNPCIWGIGNLAKIFRVTTSRIFSSLLDRLIARSVEIQEATLIALTKFACTDNHLHIDHSKSIVSAGGAKHLVQLASSGEPTIQLLSLHLLCYIAVHVPDEDGLVEAKVLDVLKFASKQSYLTRNDTLRSLLFMATIELARAAGVSNLVSRPCSCHVDPLW